MYLALLHTIVQTGEVFRLNVLLNALFRYYLMFSILSATAINALMNGFSLLVSEPFELPSHFTRIHRKQFITVYRFICFPQGGGFYLPRGDTNGFMRSFIPSVIGFLNEKMAFGL